MPALMEPNWTTCSIWAGYVASLTLVLTACVQLGAQEPIYETLLQSAVWTEKNHLFAGAKAMVWTPVDRLITPTDLYLKKKAQASEKNQRGIIELMHGHMVIIKERNQVDTRPYWIRHFTWRKIANTDAYE